MIILVKLNELFISYDYKYKYKSLLSKNTFASGKSPFAELTCLLLCHEFCQISLYLKDIHDQNMDNPSLS